MPAYDFVAPAKVVFGWGRRADVGRLTRPLGTRALLLHGSRTLEASGTIQELAGSFAAAGVECVPLGVVHREPDVQDVDAMVDRVCDLRVRAGTDVIVAVGGGSALDLGKAVAAMATNRSSGGVRDFLEGVGIGTQIVRDPLPVVAVPTTAGTGSEATKNAVISSQSPPFKKSLRDERMVPRLVVVDPELTVPLSPATTAYSGMDAVTQLIESYLSSRAQPLPRALAWHGLCGAADALETAYHDGAHRRAREMMSQAAMWSGLALANSGLGMAHGVAAALGAHCGVPHGLACAVMLPIALRVNREAAEDGLFELAYPVTGRHWESKSEAVDAVIDRIDRLGRSLGVPRRLREIGVTAEQVPQIVEGSRGNSMDGNPRPISDEELRRILLENL